MNVRQALIAQAPSLELQRAAADLIADLDARLTRAQGLMQKIGEIAGTPVGDEILESVAALVLDRDAFREAFDAYTRVEGCSENPEATMADKRKAEDRLNAACDVVAVRMSRGAPLIPEGAAGCIAHEVRVMVEQAQRLGVVLTVEQRPLQPLAMGHYETVVSVREARK